LIFDVKSDLAPAPAGARPFVNIASATGADDEAADEAPETSRFSEREAVGTPHKVAVASGVYGSLAGGIAECPAVKHFSDTKFAEETNLPISHMTSFASLDTGKICHTARTGNLLEIWRRRSRVSLSRESQVSGDIDNAL
jgi:hypothetical protein